MKGNRSNEPLYRYDRFLFQLKEAGFFKAASAVLVGTTTTNEDKLPYTVGCDWYELVGQYVPQRTPLVFDCPFGHGLMKLSLPFGELAQVEIDEHSVHIRFGRTS